MIKVKVFANYDFAETVMEFEEEFPNGTPDEEIEQCVKNIIMDQIDWTWERAEE